MQTDSSDPRVGLIFKIGFLSVAVLVGTHLSLTAYFDRMKQAEEYTKIGSIKPDALLSLRDDEKQRLTTGAMPIDKAMQQLTAKGRTGATPDIMPSASRDIAPIQGWMQMPGEVPPAMMAPEPAPSAAP